MPTEQQQPSISSKHQRPALQALNLLNQKLEKDNKYLHLENYIKQLELQRQNLYEYIEELKEELELEKKLRSSWEKRNNSAQFVDHSKVREQLQKIKKNNY